MPINQNTSRLGTGFRARVTSREFSDPNAAAISGEVARQNYRATFRSDYKLKRLRDYVKKMVARMSQGDKMAILSEYGDSRMGGGDEAVVQALITNLRESDLELLVKDVMVDEGKLAKNIREIRKAKQRQATKFSTKSFDQVFEAARKARNPRDLQKAINAYDKSFRVPKSVTRQFTGLGKEIVQVLNDVFNPIELTGMAVKMDINFEDNTSKKALVNLITNKVLLFVSLVTGRTKAGYSSAIVNDAPYKEVLQYTSYAWAAGVSGMTQDGMKSLKQAAREAKAKSRETFVQKGRSPKRLGGVKGDSSITGFEKVLDAINPLSLAKRGAGLVTGGISGLLGGLLGLGQKETGVSLGSLGGGLLGGLGGAVEYVTSLGRRGGMISGAKEGARMGGSINMFNSASFGFDPSTFGQRKLQDEAIKAASNVTPETQYLEKLGGAELLDEAAKFGIRARRLGSKEDEEKLRRDIRVKIEEIRIRKTRLEKKQADLIKKGRTLSGSARGTLGALTGQLEGLKEKFDYQGSQKVPYLMYNTGTGAELGQLKVAVPVFVVNNLADKSGMSDEDKARKIASLQTDISDREARYESTQDPALLKRINKDKSELKQLTNLKYNDRAMIGGMGSSSSLKDIVSSMGGGVPGMSTSLIRSTGAAGAEAGQGVAMNMNERNIKASHPNYIDLSRPFEAIATKGTKALRVFDVSAVIAKGFKSDDNKSRAFFSDQAVNLGVKKISPEAAKPVFIVNKSVQTDTGKLLLGVAKTLLNFIPGGGLISGQLDSLASGDGDITSMLGLATGGAGRGMGRKTTHFISGDSLGKRPNPEQVSINWSDKSYSVKPIPQFAEGGGQTASGQVRRMTPGERQEPMKVYSVNTGIADLVDLGGRSMSLIGLVSEMNSRLGMIEGLLAVGNNNTAALLKSSAITASGIGKIASQSSGSSGMNPFAGGGFPSDLNPILSGA
jgi:hypothetical protein